MRNSVSVKEIIRREFYPSRLAKEVAWTWSTLTFGIAVATISSLLLKGAGGSEQLSFWLPFLGMLAIFVASVAMRLKVGPDWSLPLQALANTFFPVESPYVRATMLIVLGLGIGLLFAQLVTQEAAGVSGTALIVIVVIFGLLSSLQLAIRSK